MSDGHGFGEEMLSYSGYLLRKRDKK